MEGVGEERGGSLLFLLPRICMVQAKRGVGFIFSTSNMRGFPVDVACATDRVACWGVVGVVQKAATTPPTHRHRCLHANDTQLCFKLRALYVFLDR